MKIVAEETKFHRFALYYDYSQDRVEFCRSLKESFGWEKFSFDVQGELKRWIFSDSLLIPVIQERFPETQIDPEVEKIVREEQSWAREQRIKNEEIDQIRNRYLPQLILIKLPLFVFT